MGLIMTLYPKLYSMYLSGTICAQDLGFRLGDRGGRVEIGVGYAA